MGYKLSILIPTLESRAHHLANLLDLIEKQGLDHVQVLFRLDKGQESIGEKRNNLLAAAEGEYVCFFDDDDIPGKDYIKHIMEGINKGVDCVSLRGIYTVNGDPEHPEAGIFEHSIKYDEYRTNHTGVPKYERFPNHLNAIKASIAKQFKFPDINHGEDTDWATQIKNSGLIKTEHYVDAVTYHYQFVTKK